MTLTVKERTEAQKAAGIYDFLREAHKSIRRIWREFPELNHRSEQGMAADGFYDEWESAVDAVDNTLYLAEGFFVRAEKEAPPAAPRKKRARKAV